ncbi:cysteine proteinase [Suhomyces tanzawaensis NRRL Y-17324]|uniref:Ubiquitin carboxyl-terminal hydrolase n=1 Tax=Suhomyces tanzawaensis NRRL Y-17324 TaxID=984487 RepID=A0A1E4SLJ9_9ASCO|nr:cysteine proteinase [Suhomyces tanzawaensis NRRL Y-17324]ODV80396.1 cysteine proteinase [Suhomyces tanzawaensis NRRL Y-17324]
MSSFKLSIKNAGKVFEIELTPSSTGAFLKEKIQELTLIPPERQKILIKGGKINDADVVSSLNLNLSQPIMVLGTPDKNLPSKPVVKQVFLEDLNANQLYKVSTDPSGLVNLGNTCYLNSSLQALYSIKILRDRLKDPGLASSAGNQASIKFNLALKSLFEQMDKKQESIKPLLPLTLIKQINPEFGTTDNAGRPQQHDAEEAYSEMIRLINDGLKLDDFFKLGFKAEQKCISLPSDETVVTYDDALKLNCHIDIKTNFLRDGIINGLKETLEKFNPTLQSNAEYEINKTITRLPRYLTVHFLRFFWRRDIGKKSKILRKVQFPFELDLAEMLDESIKADKVKVRDQIRKIEKDNLDLIRDFKKQKKDNSLTPLEQQEEDELKVASIKSKFEDELVKVLPLGYDLQTGSENPSSVYELTAVITHAGASSESGHYQAYVKDDKDLDGDRWWKFNDDKVSPVSKEKIEQFAGGGESDSALILIYKGVGL